jgi:hypothetical protein
MQYTIELRNEDIPVAYSIVKFLKRHDTHIDQTFQRYILLWIAFNNIYTTIAEMSGVKPKLNKNKDGSDKIRIYGNVKIPVVIHATDKEQLDVVHSYFNEGLKHSLITNKSTAYFVYRTPKWKNQDIRIDKRGQILNGVLNVGQTINNRNPVWSPICIKKYVSYMEGRHSENDRNILSHQVLNILYTIRNNIFHGGKRADDANAIEVVANGIPLLKSIVNSFIDSRGLTTAWS